MRGWVQAVLGFCVASLVAVAAGCVAMAHHGLAPSVWLRSAVAWGIGSVLCTLLARFGKPRPAAMGAVLLGALALLSTLFAADVDGVHRWLDIGPLHINAAALSLPALIVALAVLQDVKWIGLVVLVAASVLLAQPDASQLTSFVVAHSVLLVRWSLTPRWKSITLFVALLSVVAVWMRPDPLQPVPEVEQIFELCAAVSPILVLIAALALGAAALAPLVLASPKDNPARDGAIALTSYFVTVSLAPSVGAFPVPLVGLGMSFPVGWWLGVGLLLSLHFRGSARNQLPTGALSHEGRGSQPDY